MAVLRLTIAPFQHHSLVRQEHDRTIPLAAVHAAAVHAIDVISRSDFLNGVERFAIAGLTASAIAEAVMPNYALGNRSARSASASGEL
jgi:hypothetical protein